MQRPKRIDAERARRGVWLSLLAFALCCSVPARAAEPRPSPRDEPAADEPSRASPRAAVQAFMELARARHFGEAGAWLELSSADDAQRGTLARHLKAVLDRKLWIDLEKISDDDAGNLNDGLPPSFEQLGTLPNPDGSADPVRLRRRLDGKGWLFSRATVSHIEGWYEQLDDHWLLENLPAILLRQGPLDLLWWQWLGVSSLMLLALLLAGFTSALLRHLLGKAASKTATTWDDRLLARSRGPLTLALWLAYVRMGLPWLLLYAPAESFAHRALRGLFLANLLWTFWRLLDVCAELALGSHWILEHPGSRALIPLTRRAGKAMVAVAAIVAFLSTLGYPVTSLIAGLGIGGLALALASQKTVENLFGAFSLGIDQPFREGDFVRIDDVVGTVESLGLRSTKIRTLDRTLVSIPNGKLAEMRVETYAVRDRLRLACTLGLVYDTTEAQVRAVLSGLERVLREHPRIWPDGVSVNFARLATSSLDIEVMAWFKTSDWNEFLTIRQEVLLAFMHVVEEAGATFAFPTQTIQLSRVPPHPA